MSFLIDCEYVISSEVVQIEAHMNMHLNSFGTTKENIFCVQNHVTPIFLTYFSSD